MFRTLRITELQGISTSPEKIRVIRAIRVQNPTHHETQRNIRVLRKIIRVIRVQKTYASRNNKEYPRPQNKNPCSITSITKQFVLPIMPNKMKYTYLCAEETGNPQNEHAT